MARNLMVPHNVQFAHFIMALMIVPTYLKRALDSGPGHAVFMLGAEYFSKL